MADSTLAAIRKKVRRLTRTPSEQQLSNADIDEYINTFILYDLPQTIRLFSLRKTLTFYTDPNVDVYETNAIVGDPLENFENKYTAVYTPIYVAGYEACLYQSEAGFYEAYPLTNNISTETTGNGVIVNFAGTLSNVPIVSNRVVFNSIDANNNGLELHDDGLGVLSGDGVGTIDYITGAYTLAWTVAPASGKNINSLTVPYTAARPDTVLYFNNKFTVRPIPDQVYPIQVEVDVRPNELLATGTSPDLEQWSQLISYGAAKKVFEDRGTLEDVQAILPELKNQEILVLRRSNAQVSQNRTDTIYKD